MRTKENGKMDKEFICRKCGNNLDLLENGKGYICKHCADKILLSYAERSYKDQLKNRFA